MYFINRPDAARQLAEKLEKYKNTNSVILAVPRGGVPIGYYLANHLNLPFDLLMTKKIGHPNNPEFAIGAVGLKDAFIEETQGIPLGYFDKEIANVQQQLKERYEKFMGKKSPASIKDKIIIIVDDGVATGRTILATLKMLRSQQPKKIVVAVPVSSQQAARRISEQVDEFICLYIPAPFFGVGNFYQDFSQTTDEEVIAMLKELNARENEV